MQLIGIILVYVVFIQLFIVLSIYLWRVLYDYFKADKAKKPEKPPPEIEDGNIKLHVSGGLLEVNRLPDEQENVERE